MKLIKVWIVTFIGFSLVFAISYIESSNGLETPTLEGGRTELEFADINNDGNVDILSIGDHGNPYVNTQEHGIMVWFGDGQGNWSVFQNGEFGYGGITVGDVNNDGIWDVGFGMHHNYAPVGQLGTKILEVALGDGTGQNWTAWDSGLASHGETWGMFGTAFVDFNNDGWLDLVSNSFGGSAGVHVYLNYHNGFWDQSFGFTGGLSKCDVAVGDINNDGNADFVVGQQYGSVYLNDGTGNFTLADHNLPLPSGQQGRPGVALGDIDNDGAQEFSFVDAGGGIDVWKWNQTGDSWVSRGNNLPNSGFEATQLYDMNCDSFVDVIGFGHHIGKVWLGDGAGNWTEAATFTTPTYGDFTAIHAGSDIDHNGFPDIALVDDEGTSPNDHNVLHCFKEASVPESLRITPMFPRGSEQLVGGSVQFIDWVSAVSAGELARVRLELSLSGPNGQWSLIADSLRNGGRFQWFVPISASADCYIRYTVTTLHGTNIAVTPRQFTILPSTGFGESGTQKPGSDLRAQVFPNPIQANTVLSYELPVSERIRIILYDVTGRQLEVLHDGFEAQGWHQLKFNLKRIGSGIYFCQLQTGHSSTRLKFIKP
jgi:FG-GAP-like repeat/Secretion system C-terminal sorting domain